MISNHIYCEDLVGTLCGGRSHKNDLGNGYFYSIKEALFWCSGRGTYQLNKGPVVSQAHMRPPIGKLPELEEGNNYIAVPGKHYRTSVCLMCNDCLAIMRLRELE